MDSSTTVVVPAPLSLEESMKLASLLKRLFAFGLAAWMLTLLGAPAGAVPQ